MQSETKKLGAILTGLGWVIGLALLVLLFNKIIGHEGDFETSVIQLNGSQAAEVKIKQNRQGHYLLRAQVNESSALFMVDSGATITSIPMNLAKKLDLKKGLAFKVDTANGVATVYQTVIKELKFGNIILKNVRASLNPGMNGNEALLGMNVLKHFELIQRDRTLIIRQY